MSNAAPHIAVRIGVTIFFWTIICNLNVHVRTLLGFQRFSNFLFNIFAMLLVEGNNFLRAIFFAKNLTHDVNGRDMVFHRLIMKIDVNDLHTSRFKLRLHGISSSFFLIKRNDNNFSVA